MSRELSAAALALNITPSNELCWERQLGGSAFSRTFRVKVPGRAKRCAIKMIDVVLIAKARGIPPVRVWKEFLADVALVNCLPEKCDRIMGYNTLTTNPERTHLYMWKQLGGVSLAHFAFSEGRQILQATKFQRFSYLMHRYVMQIAQGLAAVHAEGLVHGAVRLENIVLELKRENAASNDQEINKSAAMDENLPSANIHLTDTLVGRNASFDTTNRIAYWPEEMFQGVAGSSLSSTYRVKVTQEVDCYQLGLVIIELVTSKRLTELSLAPLSFQLSKKKELLKSVRGTCPELALCAKMLLAPIPKRAPAQEVFDRLSNFVEGHKMHTYYCPVADDSTLDDSTLDADRLPVEGTALPRK